MFRQYTIEGESIEELQETPQKRMVDELMGRKNGSSKPINMRDETTP